MTSAVFVLRDSSAAEPAATSAAEQAVWPAHPGGARLRSRPQASLTSPPCAADPAMPAAAAPAGLPTLNPRHDAVQASVALTVTCSAESQRPLSWMLRWGATCCSVPLPVKTMVYVGAEAATAADVTAAHRASPATIQRINDVVLTRKGEIRGDR